MLIELGHMMCRRHHHVSRYSGGIAEVHRSRHQKDQTASYQQGDSKWNHPVSQPRENLESDTVHVTRNNHQLKLEQFTNYVLHRDIELYLLSHNMTLDTKRPGFRCALYIPVWCGNLNSCFTVEL